MPRRSERKHRGGRFADDYDDKRYEGHAEARERNREVHADKYGDDDELYEGHAAARERNREFYARTHGDDDHLPPYKGRCARRTDKAKPPTETTQNDRAHDEGASRTGGGTDVFVSFSKRGFFH